MFYCVVLNQSQIFQLLNTQRYKGSTHTYTHTHTNLQDRADLYELVSKHVQVFFWKLGFFKNKARGALLRSVVELQKKRFHLSARRRKLSSLFHQCIINISLCPVNEFLNCFTF